MGKDLLNFLGSLPEDKKKLLNTELDKVTVNKNVTSKIQFSGEAL
jgi:hypothetical protein